MPTAKKESKINPTPNNSNLKKVLIIVAVVVVLVAFIAIILGMRTDESGLTKRQQRAILEALAQPSTIQSDGYVLTEEDQKAIVTDGGESAEPEELSEEEKQAILKQLES